MKRILFSIFLTFLSFIAFAQKSPAELLVEGTGYEYLVEDMMFVKTCSELHDGKAEEEIPKLTENERILRIYQTQVYAIYFLADDLLEDENLKKETLQKYIDESTEKLIVLDTEAKELLTKKNYKQFKYARKRVKVSLVFCKWMCRSMKE